MFFRIGKSSHAAPLQPHHAAHAQGAAPENEPPVASDVFVKAAKPARGEVSLDNFGQVASALLQGRLKAKQIDPTRPLVSEYGETLVMHAFSEGHKALGKKLLDLGFPAFPSKRHSMIRHHPEKMARSILAHLKNKPVEFRAALFPQIFYFTQTRRDLNLAADLDEYLDAARAVFPDLAQAPKEIRAAMTAWALVSGNTEVVEACWRATPTDEAYVVDGVPWGGYVHHTIYPKLLPIALRLDEDTAITACYRNMSYYALPACFGAHDVNQQARLLGVTLSLNDLRLTTLALNAVSKCSSATIAAVRAGLARLSSPLARYLSSLDETDLRATARPLAQVFDGERDIVQNAPWVKTINRCLDSPDPSALRALPHMLLLPYAQLINDRLAARFPDAVRDLDAGRFDAQNPTHVLLAEFRLYDENLASKYFDDEVKLQSFQDAKVEPRKLPYKQEDEHWYLAYEAQLLQDRVISPLRQQGKKLAVVANLTYGGTAVSPLPLKKLKREGIRLIFTKQPSTSVGPSDFNKDLFKAADIDYFKREKDNLVVVVVDGSRNNQYPTAFRGYRNFVDIMNATAFHDRSTAWLQAGLQREHFVTELPQGSLGRKLAPDAPPQRGYQLFYASPTTKPLRTLFEEVPARFNLQDIKAPAFLLWQSAISNDDFAHHVKQGDRLANYVYSQCLLPHIAGHFDDNTHHQNPHVIVGRHGYKLRSRLHKPARKAFKALDAVKHARGSRL